jgi:ubiquinone/menaquinone biosynthesis C-methylase UbiE
MPIGARLLTVAAETVYDRASATYGLVGPDLFGHFGRRLVDQAAAGQDAVVLDVATGAGAVLLAAAPRVRRVVGVDLASAMLERNREKACASGVTNVTLLRMDACRLGLRAAAFDVVTSGFALDSFPDPCQALREMRRVLRPGGVLAMSVAPHWWWEGDSRWRWLADLLTELGVQSSSDSELRDLTGIQSVVLRCGFDPVQVVEESHPLTWPDASQWWRWAWSHGWRTVLEAMTAQQVAYFRQHSMHALDGMIDRDGAINGAVRVFLIRGIHPQ